MGRRGPLPAEREQQWKGGEGQGGIEQQQAPSVRVARQREAQTERQRQGHDERARRAHETGHERIELALSAADARKLPPYLTYREKGETVEEQAEDVAGVLGSGPELPNWLEQVANKGAGELEIDGGENVMLGHTGRKLGTVKDVLFDGDDLVGIVLLPDGLFKSEVILPRRFLSRSDDAALFAQIEEGDLEKLTPFER